MRLPRFDTVFSRRILGIFVIVGTILVVILAVTRPDPFKETQVINVRFDNVSGLGRIDRNVRIGGGNAGHIGAVTREGDDVVVELEIEPGIHVHTDARADLRPHTLFEGSAFVDLHPGSPSAPLMQEGDEIPKIQTSNYVSLDEALRVLDDDNREALKAIVGSFSATLQPDVIASLRRTLKQAPALLEDLGPTARALQGRNRTELAGSIDGLSRTAAAIASREADLAPLIDRTNHTLAALDVDGGASLDAALRALPGGLEELEADAGKLALLIDTLDETSVELLPVSEQLGPLLSDAQPLLQRTPAILEAATPLIDQLHKVLDRAAGAAPQLEAAIGALAPSAKLLQESVLPVITGDSRYGVPSYVELVSAFTGGGAIARHYQTEAQNPTGSAGHIIRTGTYLDVPGTISGLTTPSCATIALISQQLADQLEALGLCT